MRFDSKLQFKKRNPQRVYTAEEIANIAVQKHIVILPLYTKKLAYRFLTKLAAQAPSIAAKLGWGGSQERVVSFLGHNYPPGKNS